MKAERRALYNKKYFAWLEREVGGYQAAQSSVGEGDKVLSHAVEFLPSNIETNQFGRFLIFQLRTLKLEMLNQSECCSYNIIVF